MYIPTQSHAYTCITRVRAASLPTYSYNFETVQGYGTHMFNDARFSFLYFFLRDYVICDYMTRGKLLR